MSVPKYAVYFRGKPACPCLVRWLPAYEAELLRRGVIRFHLDIYQLIGGVAASGGTHAMGGCFDIAQHSKEAIWVARQMGADATWERDPWSPPHAHGVLTGCPHNGPAAYQIAAVVKRYNGLGKGGLGGKDTGPRPLSGRSWQQGIAWAEQQGLDPDLVPELDKMNPANYFVGVKGQHVRWLSKRLIAHGHKWHYRRDNGVFWADLVFTAKQDQRAVRAFQRKQGWRGVNANGLPGHATLKLLAANPVPKKKRFGK